MRASKARKHELARRTSDSQTRTSLLDLAQKWIDLAELSEHDPWNDALRLRAIQAAIGQTLRNLYDVPRELPHNILTILIQLDVGSEATGHSMSCGAEGTNAVLSEV